MIVQQLAVELRVRRDLRTLIRQRRLLIPEKQNLVNLSALFTYNQIIN